MRYLTIFATYDSDSVIHEYVVFYLKKLNEVSDVVFVSDCDFPHEELEKINNYCLHIISQRHGEYDFGSYKRGFFYAKEEKLLDIYEKIIFCNDSVFGPFTPLKKILLKLDRFHSPAVGIFKYKKDVLQDEHLQSYFIIVDSEIFNSNFFHDFFSSICSCVNKESIVIQYEVGLSQVIKSHGYTLAALFDSDSVKDCNEKSLPHFYPESLIKKGFPFLKICLFKESEKFFFTKKKFKEISGKIRWNYNTTLLTDYLNAKKILINQLPVKVKKPGGFYGPLLDGMCVSQSFVVEKKILEKISVLCATYMRKNNSHLRITITEEQNSVILFEKTVSVLNFIDNGYNVIPVEIKLEKKKKYFLSLYPVATDDNNYITLYFSNIKNSTENNFFNGKQTKKSVCIRYFFKDILS